MGTIKLDVNQYATIAEVKAKIVAHLKAQTESNNEQTITHDQLFGTHQLCSDGTPLRDDEELFDPYGDYMGKDRPLTFEPIRKKKKDRRLANQRLIDRFIRESIRCIES